MSAGGQVDLDQCPVVGRHEWRCVRRCRLAAGPSPLRHLRSMYRLVEPRLLLAKLIVSDMVMRIFELVDLYHFLGVVEQFQAVGA